jgi:hypothetical protein
MNGTERAVRKSSMPSNRLFLLMLITVLAGLAFMVAAGLGILPVQPVTDFVDRTAHIHD